MPGRRTAVVVGAFVLVLSVGGTVVRAGASSAPSTNPGVSVGHSYKNDVSMPLRLIPAAPARLGPRDEANPNLPLATGHVNEPDGVRQRALSPASMPATAVSFDGIPFPGVACSCAPPSATGEAGPTQYVQSVNEGYQVFDKTSGASLLGPSSLATLWSGFGGVCELAGRGDPVLLYDQLAGRWVITQFAGTASLTDECIAVSTSSDATGSFNRYGFHLGSNFYDLPKLGVWPDAYYMSAIVYNAAATAFLGPQPFAFDRAAMLAGNPATFVTTGITGGPLEDPYLPADLDGSILPPSGAPNPFVEWPGGGTYRIYHFHVDWGTPALSTFTLFGAPTAAAFTDLCTTTRSCVPQAGTTAGLDGVGGQLMFRAAYRNFGSHESLVGNYTVKSNLVAGVRWFELRNVTSGSPTVFQESTYQPDTTWRWLGSAAMDASGDLAVGYSASSAAISPQIRYAGRLAGDSANVLAQGEATLFAGAGSQTGTGNRWGDYSSLTVDPVDDCTFWYTNEYYATTGSFNWRTRIGSFKFPSCTSTPAPAVYPGGSAITAESGSPPNNVIDPGETVSVNFTLVNAGPVATGGVVATLRATGGVQNPSGPQSYGALAATGGTAMRSFTFTADPNSACGDTLVATLHLQDGATDRGDVTYTFRLGTDRVSLSENFDGATAPALPAGWAASNPTGPAPLWVTSSSGTPAPPADTAPNAAFVDDPGVISDKQLQSPSIPIHTASAQLTFRNNYNLEPGFDGGVLEISIDGGAFQDITAAGGSFLDGGYTATVSNLTLNPLGGRPAWSGSSGGLVTTTVKLPAAAAGHNVVLRWRMGSDSSVSGQGWRVDSIQIKDGNECLPLRALTVTKAGAGSGTITSSPAGINCGAACSRNIANGTSVTLTVVPASRSRFGGWSGDCAGTSTCTLAMSANHSASATFALLPLSPPKCVVPKVVGKTLKKAKARIKKAHCKVGKVSSKASTKKQKGHVLRQSPKAGKKLKNGAKVNLTVGKGRKPPFTPPKCVVPRVVGQKLAKAKARIKKAHCKVGKVTKKATTAKKNGKVLAQRPKAGKRLKNGAEVTLTVGKGPGKTKKK